MVCETKIKLIDGRIGVVCIEGVRLKGIRP